MNDNEEACDDKAYPVLPYPKLASQPQTQISRQMATASTKPPNLSCAYPVPVPCVSPHTSKSPSVNGTDPENPVATLCRFLTELETTCTKFNQAYASFSDLNEYLQTEVPSAEQQAELTQQVFTVMSTAQNPLSQVLSIIESHHNDIASYAPELPSPSSWAASESSPSGNKWGPPDYQQPSQQFEQLPPQQVEQQPQQSHDKTGKKKKKAQKTQQDFGNGEAEGDSWQAVGKHKKRGSKDMSAAGAAEGGHRQQVAPHQAGGSAGSRPTHGHHQVEGNNRHSQPVRGGGRGEGHWDRQQHGRGQWDAPRDSRHPWDATGGGHQHQNVWKARQGEPRQQQPRLHGDNREHRDGRDRQRRDDNRIDDIEKSFNMEFQQDLETIVNDGKAKIKRCSDCQREVDLAQEYYDYVIPGILRRTDWQCNICRKCQICNCNFSGEDAEVAADPMLPCDRCDRSFHYYCLEVERAPEGQFYCTMCTANDPYFGAKHRMVILMGPQCAGKSTLSSKFKRMFGWIIVNQDTFGTRGKCIAVAHAALQKKQSVVIDRTNLTKQHRQKFMEVAAAYTIPVDCVWLNIPFEVTLERLKSRRNHPNFNYCPETVKILQSVYRELEPPTEAEGFRQIYVFSCEAELNKCNLAVLMGITHHSEKHESAKEDNARAHKEYQELLIQEWHKRNSSVSSADFERALSSPGISLTSPSIDFMANLDINHPVAKGLLSAPVDEESVQYDSDCDDVFDRVSDVDDDQNADEESTQPQKEDATNNNNKSQGENGEPAMAQNGKTFAPLVEESKPTDSATTKLNPNAPAWKPSWMK